MNERRPDARDFVGTDRSANTTSANGHPAFNLPGDHGLRQRNNKIGVIVVGTQLVSSEVDDLVPGVTELSDEVLLQPKATVIGGNSYSHTFPFLPLTASSVA